LSEVWVVNASPIISLAKAGFLDLLDKLAPKLIVPEAVASEVLAGPEMDPARKTLETGWGNRASPRVIPERVLEWGLGAGESAVLALSLEASGGRLSSRGAVTASRSPPTILRPVRRILCRIWS
jgi:predicted nucleic acid-binding protein